MLCRAVPCRAVPCRAVPCRAVPCCAVLCCGGLGWAGLCCAGWQGSGVADTIRSGITNLDYFVDRPDILAYGMMCALAGTGVWMMAATYWEVGMYHM